MKKLLVILMVGAGFVTVASALEPLDCNTNTTNQCCIDLHSIVSALNQSPTNSITTTDKYDVLGVDLGLINDGTDVDNGCLDWAAYNQNGKRNGAVFQWAPGYWQSTIAYDYPSTSANNR